MSGPHLAQTWAVLAALAMIAPPSLCTAQSTRTIALPDSVGANVNLADSTRGRGSRHDYDAVLGNWRFRFEYRNDDGTFGHFDGSWSFEIKAGGGLLLDAWRPDDPGTPMAQSLYTIRLYDSVFKAWRVIGANSEGGTFTPGVSWKDGNDLVLFQHTDRGLVRFRYFAIEANRFLWRADRSTDGGKTWTRDDLTMELTRISR